MDGYQHPMKKLRGTEQGRRMMEHVRSHRKGNNMASIGKSRFAGKIDSSKFAGPNESFPVQDKRHAGLAKAFAPRSEAAGNITPGQEKAIVAKANAVLGESGGKSNAKKKNRAVARRRAQLTPPR